MNNVFKYPYDAEKDKAINGANKNNCDFKFFATPEMLKEWERGEKDGNLDKLKREAV